MRSDWVPIEETRGKYEIASDGTIQNLLSGKILKWNCSGTHGRYAGVRLYVFDGPPLDRLVHVLVATTFIGYRPPGMEVNHKNFDRLDNRVENLEWVTRVQNMQHARANRKVFRKGSAVKTAKLLEEETREIRQLYAHQIYNQPELARIYGVSQVLISRIVRRAAWIHVP